MDIYYAVCISSMHYGYMIWNNSLPTWNNLIHIMLIKFI